jgi:hypothetical protein
MGAGKASGDLGESVASALQSLAISPPDITILLPKKESVEWRCDTTTTVEALR